MKKNLHSCLLVILALLMSLPVFGQQYTFVPGSTVGNNIPWGNASSNRRQNLYYPTDFNAPSGSITTLYIMPNTSVSTVSYTNVTVRMGATALNTFTSGPWISTGLTTVYNGAATLNAGTGGWLVLTLQTPYVYNNTQNLIVDFTTTGFSASYFMLHGNSGFTDRSLFGSATAASVGTQARLQQLGFDMITCAGPTGLAASG